MIFFLQNHLKGINSQQSGLSTHLAFLGQFIQGTFESEIELSQFLQSCSFHCLLLWKVYLFLFILWNLECFKLVIIDSFIFELSMPTMLNSRRLLGLVQWFVVSFKVRIVGFFAVFMPATMLNSMFYTSQYKNSLERLNSQAGTF